MDIDKNNPNIDGDDVKTISADDKELEKLESEVEKEEETVEKSADYLEKKRQKIEELKKRREDALALKKQQREEAKQLKKDEKELKKEDDEEISESDKKEEKVVIDEEALTDKIKRELKEDQELEKIETNVESLLDEYPDIEVDQLNNIEQAIPQLKKIYPQKSLSEITNIAVQNELGSKVETIDFEKRTAVEASGDTPSSKRGGVSLSSQYIIEDDMKAVLKKEGKSVSDFLTMIVSLEKQGHDISQYKVKKIK